MDKAKLDDQRYATLLKQNSIARQAAEDQTFVVRQSEGQVATDKALIAQQDLDIYYCHIVAAALTLFRTTNPTNSLARMSSSHFDSTSPFF